MSHIWNKILSAPAPEQPACALVVLPVEIYLEILEHIFPQSMSGLGEEDYRLLGSLALVCRFFCAIVLPKLYEEITLNLSSHDGNIHGQMSFSDKKARAYADFCRNTSQKKGLSLSLSSYVKTWRLKWPILDFSDLPTYPIFHPISSMANIQEIVFENVKIDEAVCDHLCLLPQLKILKLYSCLPETYIHGGDWHSDVPVGNTRSFFSLNLRELLVTGRHAYHFLKYTNWKSLQSLEIDNTDTLWDAFPDEDANTIQLPLDLALKRLTVDFCSNPADLADMLWRTPHLEHLTIASTNILEDWVNFEDYIDASMLRRLECVIGHWGICRALVGNRQRPIAHLEIIEGSPSLPPEIDDVLRHSTSLITRLTVPISWYPEYQMMDCLPRLRHLELARNGGPFQDTITKLPSTIEDMLRRTLLPRSKHPDLVAFTFRLFALDKEGSFYLDPSREQSVLAMVSSVFPSLRYARFSYGEEWHYTCCGPGLPWFRSTVQEMYYYQSPQPQW